MAIVLIIWMVTSYRCVHSIAILIMCSVVPVVSSLQTHGVCVVVGHVPQIQRRLRLHLVVHTHHSLSLSVCLSVCLLSVGKI